ncbi:hypothetical protein [Aquimarina sp. AU474]|nr:hypothetical protein [Aquimarina sp. AU474]
MNTNHPFDLLQNLFDIFCFYVKTVSDDSDIGEDMLASKSNMIF